MDDEIDYQVLLVSKWFHSINDDGTFIFQGYVKQYIGSDFYLIEIINWKDESKRILLLKSLNDLKEFNFYNSYEDMKAYHSDFEKIINEKS